MSFTASKISYRDTNSFSRIVNDYLDGNSSLDQFYKYKPNIQGIREAIEQRRNIAFDRKRLVEVLHAQYSGKELNDKLAARLLELESDNCFTITTAHQPNIFTGHLYFIYKIIHAIKLADKLKRQLPEYNFVPVYYMGSEDADLDELGEINVDGKKYKWETTQRGAVGRMLIDKPLLKLIDEMQGQLSVQPFGSEIINIIRSCYREGETIEQATFNLVHNLFGSYGLVVLIPDNQDLKKQFVPVLKKELLEQFSSPVVAEAISKFPEEYKVQAAGRELNLFYLKDDIRERIEKQGVDWKVINTNIRFTEKELLAELKNYPERFSPNVILRPLFQEFILPNIIFIGGGGELAYWLELLQVFEAVDIPFPVLILRNSFAVSDNNTNQLLLKLKLTYAEIFRKEQDLINEFVNKETTQKLSLADEKKKLEVLYSAIASDAIQVDPTLAKHVESLRVSAINKIKELEKKLMRAERVRFEASIRQLKKLRSRFYPSGNLQERVDNLLPYYARWGKDFIQSVYDHSEAFPEDFTILADISEASS